MIAGELQRRPPGVSGDGKTDGVGVRGERRDDPSRSGWLTRNVLVLSGVWFLQDAASELVYPVLPIFLTAVLGPRLPSSDWSRAWLRARPR